MAAAALHTDIVPSRQGWRALMLDRAAHGAVGRAQLCLSDHPGERGVNGRRPPRHSRAHRVGVVARSRARRAHAGPAAQCVARRHDPVHAMAALYLGFGGQRRVLGAVRTFHYFPSRSSCR